MTNVQILKSQRIHERTVPIPGKPPSAPHGPRGSIDVLRLNDGRLEANNDAEPQTLTEVDKFLESFKLQKKGPNEKKKAAG